MACLYDESDAIRLVKMLVHAITFIPAYAQMPTSASATSSCLMSVAH